MPRSSAAIERISDCRDGTRRILLRFEDSGAETQSPDTAQEPFGFIAGQHVLVHAADGSRIPFSIASAPARLPWLELHYYPLSGRPAAAAMDDLLAQGSGFRIQMEGPYGDVAVTEPGPRPLTLIVAGTGAAQAYSIAEHLQASEPRQPVRLYWHVPSAEALYCDADFRRFARRRWFHYQPVIDGLRPERSAAVPAEGDEGDPGAERWVREQASAIADAELILCGSPDFVYRITDAISAVGLSPARIRSDAFAYAPRQDR